jgi:hypothetical protein
MYEMQGPRSALPHLASRLLDCPALPDRPPLPDTRPKFRSPGSPAVLGVSPGIGIRLWWCVNFYSVTLTWHKGFPE